MVNLDPNPFFQSFTFSNSRFFNRSISGMKIGCVMVSFWPSVPSSNQFDISEFSLWLASMTGKKTCHPSRSKIEHKNPNITPGRHVGLAFAERTKHIHLRQFGPDISCWSFHWSGWRFHFWEHQKVGIVLFKLLARQMCWIRYNPSPIGHWHHFRHWTGRWTARGIILQDRLRRWNSCWRISLYRRTRATLPYLLQTGR